MLTHIHTQEPLNGLAPKVDTSRFREQLQVLLHLANPISKRMDIFRVVLRGFLEGLVEDLILFSSSQSVAE